MLLSISLFARSRALTRILASVFRIFVTACRSVRDCGGENHLQHHAGHLPPPVHVRRHRGSALQGQ